jgi:CBS domain-containing protein
MTGQANRGQVLALELRPARPQALPGAGELNLSSDRKRRSRRNASRSAFRRACPVLPVKAKTGPTLTRQPARPANNVEADTRARRTFLPKTGAQLRIPAKGRGRKAEVKEMSEQTNAAAPATAADIMRPPLTTVEQADHIAAAAYLMKRAGTTALMVLDAQTGQPIGIITEADIAHAVADGKDVNSTRIHALMTTRPTVINTTTSVRDAAQVMTSGHFRHLPVVGGEGLVGIVDITDVCRALLEPGVSPPPVGMARPE